MPIVLARHDLIHLKEQTQALRTLNPNRRDLVDYFKGQGANSSVSYGSMDKPRWSMNNMEGHPHAVHGLPNGKGKGEHGAQCAPPGACCIM